MDNSTVEPQMRKKGKRLRAYSFTPESVTHIMTKGWHVGYAGEGDSIECVEGIPEDAQRVNQFYDAQRDRFVIIFEHPTFNETYGMGEVIEFGDVRYIHYPPEPERVE